MKQVHIFVLGFSLMLEFHCGESIVPGRPTETYHDWFERVVRNCKPGSKFRGYDNRPCTCARSGFPMCTGPMMPGARLPETGLSTDVQGPDQETCKPRSGRWLAPDKCNWCFCDMGYTICTRMGCGKSSDTKTLSGLNYCKKNPQGKFKDKEGCNWCYCLDFNNLVCTQMACRNIIKTKKPKSETNVCKTTGRTPGRFLSEDGCNWCFCVGPTLLMCTIMACPEPKKLKNRSSLKAIRPKIDEDDYHRLLTEQKFAKTKLRSLKEMAQKCKQGDKFKEPNGCNWCTCIEEGVVICDQEECN